MRNEFKYIKPFLILLNVLPDKIYNLWKEKIIYTDLISMDDKIVKVLRQIWLKKMLPQMQQVLQS
jgi:hypothetical protein